jgi:kynurenine aminotransferase
MSNNPPPRYISNIEMAGGKVVYVPLTPPPAGKSRTASAGEWRLDREKLESAIGPKTKMIVCSQRRLTGLSYMD